MKVLFPIGSFYPALSGGPNNTIYWLAKFLVKNQHQTTVISTSSGLKNKQVPINKWSELSGVKVIYYNFFNWQLPFRFILNSILAVKKNDIIILSSFFYIPSIIIAIYSILTKKKLLWAPRGEFSNSALSFKSFSKKARLFLVKKTVGKHIVFHATSETERNDIRAIFPKNRIYILPNFIEIQPAQLDEIEEYFLFIGRFHPIKALDKIILALDLSEQFKQSKYIFKFVGYEDSPGYKAQLVKLISEKNLTSKIHFIDRVSGTKKDKLYAQSKFTFLTSESENFGNVVVESLIHGTPVVASKGTPWDILEQKKAGYWVDNSPEALSQIIDQIISLPDNEYDKMRIKSRSLVEQNFSVEKNIYKYIEILEEV